MVKHDRNMLKMKVKSIDESSRANNVLRLLFFSSHLYDYQARASAREKRTRLDAKDVL